MNACLMFMLLIVVGYRCVSCHCQDSSSKICPQGATVVLQFLSHSAMLERNLSVVGVSVSPSQNCNASKLMNLGLCSFHR